ncbi:hypothetical protein C0J45_16283 [Silurus meridionalis]|nr:hypothetical protein C0J45_16283 [Silurus meridionalis]
MVQNGAEKPDCRDGDAYVSHVTDAPCHHQSSASTSLAARNPGGKVQDVEIVTFQDPLKKNRLKRTLEPEHRPPKKEYVNYKVYQQTLKMKKSKEKEDEEKSTQIKPRTELTGFLAMAVSKSDLCPEHHLAEYYIKPEICVRCLNLVAI